jgi:nucleotide-binding universal stress UspA family protein
VTFKQSLAVCLAHSAVFFTREAWRPVADARGEGKSTSSAEQSTSQEQVGAEGGGSESPTLVTGASSPYSNDSGTIAGAASANANNQGLNLSASNIGYGGSDNITTVTDQSEDPEIIEAALGGAETIAVGAEQSNTAVSEAAVNAAAGTAQYSIAAGVADTAQDSEFGEEALQFAANAQAEDTTTLETAAQEYAAGLETTANNALAAAQNETLAGVTPAQTFQEYGGSSSLTGLLNGTSLVTWVIVISAIAAIYYYFFRKKAA